MVHTKVRNEVLLKRVVELTRNNGKLDAPVFIPSNALRFLHKERSEALRMVHLSNCET